MNDPPCARNGRFEHNGAGFRSGLIGRAEPASIPYLFGGFGVGVPLLRRQARVFHLMVPSVPVTETG